MRPKRIHYILSALSVSGYVSGATGVGPFTTIAGSPNDGTGHTVTLASTVNLSAITMTVVGTNPEGNAQTATIAGPNNNTVTTTQYFKTVTSVSASSTLGANTMNIGWGVACATPAYVTALYKVAGPYFVVEIESGTCTYTQQNTNDDPFSTHPPTWMTVGTASVTATTANVASVGTTALRTIITTHSSGVLDLCFSMGR